MAEKYFASVYLYQQRENTATTLGFVHEHLSRFLKNTDADILVGFRHLRNGIRYRASINSYYKSDDQIKEAMNAMVELFNGDVRLATVVRKDGKGFDLVDIYFDQKE